MNSRFCFLVFFLSILFFEFLQAQKKLYPKTLLWRISGNNLQKPSYLFGTMHLEDRRLFYFGDSLYKCLENAEGFAMEIDPDSAMAAMFQAMSEPDTTGYLKDVLTKKELDRVAKPLEKKYGVRSDRITRKQAWMYSVNKLTTKKRNDMETPVDTYLYNIAKRQGKWVGGIEDVSDQFDLVTEMGTGFDVQGLLADKAGRNLTARLIDIYLAQDLNSIWDWTNAMEYDTKDALLIKRNIKMAYRMDSMSKLRSNFFAVGAAHLAGDDGIIDLLEKKGFIVEPVFSSKKIAPEKYEYKHVALPWQQVQDKRKTFTVEMPGKPYPIQVKGFLTMETYADMGSGLIYFATSIKSGKKSIDADSLLANFAKNISGSKKISSKRKIELKGVQGVEILVSNDEYSYRVQGFVKNELVYLVMTCATKAAMLVSEEANRYHQSLVMHEVVPKKPGDHSVWENFSLATYGFSLEMPGKPVRNYELENNFNSQAGAKSWSMNCYTVSDEESDIFYMFFVRTTKPGYHVLDDTAVFAESRRNAEASYAGNISQYEIFELQGFPAMRMNANHKENDYVTRSLHVNRGDRCYSVVVIGNENRENEEKYSRFINSFKLNSYPKGKWEFRHSAGNVFKTWGPANFEEMKNEDETDVANDIPKIGSLISFDSLSGYSFAIDRQVIAPYYWAKSDSLFFANYLSQYSGWQDSVVESNTIQNGGITGMEYLVKSPIVSNMRRIRILPYRDTVFILYSIIPGQEINDSDYNRFFSEFSFTNETSTKNYLKNKTDRILVDLTSEDSVIREAASSYLATAPFSEEDLPALHEAMKTNFKDSENDYLSIDRRLLSAIAEVKHLSTIEFIRENYRKLGSDKEEKKFGWLSLLAKTLTRNSYDLFLKLSLETPPRAGNAIQIQYSLTDSLLLTRTLFPKILSLSSDSNYVKMLPYVVNRLVDSNLLSIDEVRPYAKNFYKFAESELIRLKDVSDYDFYAFSIVDLLGKLNDTESNRLLEAFLISSHLNLVESAAFALIKNNQSVSRSHLETIASDKYYRSSFYRQLKVAGKEKIFPAKYSNQKSISESDMYVMANDDYEPTSISYLGERKVEYKGLKQKFLLFKVTYTYEDSEPETFLGVTGPFTVNGKKIITEPEIVDMYSDENFDSRKIDEQLKKYLESLENYSRK